MLKKVAKRRVGYGVGSTLIDQQSGAVSRTCRDGSDVPLGEVIIVVLGQQFRGCWHGLCIVLGLVKILKILIPEVKIIIIHLPIICKRFIGFMRCLWLGGFSG